MKNKTISITDDLYEELKKEENASALICRLLYDYFKKKDYNKMNDDEKLKYLTKIKEMQDIYKILEIKKEEFNKEFKK